MLKELNKKIFDENKKITGIVGMILIFSIVAGVFSYEARAMADVTLDAKEELEKLRNQAGQLPTTQLQVGTGSESRSGTTIENGRTDEDFEITYSAVIEVEATLTWTDDPAGIGRTNNPDEFMLTITSPNGESKSSSMVSNSESGNLQGTVTLAMSVDVSQDNSGEWVVTVEAGECGDITGPLGRFSFEADTENDWQLQIAYSYYILESESET